ncbi:hypothetical protein Emag_007086 [Eimeria magna]
MGCMSSKEAKRSRHRKAGGRVAKAAAAYEGGRATEPTSREKQAAAERRERQRQLAELKRKSMREKRKKAEAEVKECFKDKPPTGGAAPDGYRG